MESILLLCIFAICMFLLFGEVLTSLAHFKIRLFIFLLLRCKSSLYMLGNSPLSSVPFLKYFFPICVWSAHSLDTVFCGVEIFHFNEVQLINFLFMDRN